MGSWAHGNFTNNPPSVRPVKRRNTAVKELNRAILCVVSTHLHCLNSELPQYANWIDICHTNRLCCLFLCSCSRAGTILALNKGSLCNGCNRS